MNIRELDQCWDEQFSLVQFYPLFFQNFTNEILNSPVRTKLGEVWTCAFKMPRIIHDDELCIVKITTLIPRCLQSKDEFEIVQGSPTIGTGKIIP